MSQEEEQQQIFSDPKFFLPIFFFGHKIFFRPKTFFGPKIFLPKFFFRPNIFFQPKLTQIFYGEIFFSNQNFLLTQNNLWTHFFPIPKTMFGGRKQSFGTLSFLNWQRAKILLKLEFDTEDQVLFII